MLGSLPTIQPDNSEHGFPTLFEFARLAQSVERETLTSTRNLKVAGSTPASGFSYKT
ncbi:hypothetical protein VFPPC_17529 [Pochonia chlamydosporia 170]|uniref:Uncharacterized protein n=1 Tax=Pochonia chlamydosporia 170 TaxID=1380566 RepID=A0A219AR97_METCM|nr:hypothetical protein VFPPC_17529 [Pochonia chlamydosporia 170]OWT43308.1 hypothetical protein VFPPC_17529 [Pochonia chlamydosporia 170]